MNNNLERREQATPDAGATPPPASPRRSWIGAALAWGRDLSLSVLIAVVVILFIYQPVKVEGTSMMPSLVDQERIFINKFIYRFGLGDIERGDMVVFWFPGDPSKSYIKRVVGLPGDVVEIQDGNVIVNSETLQEEYVPAEYRDLQSRPSMVVPDEHFYVMGDHRSSSNDSRNWGPVARGQIYGKAVFGYWPLERAGPLQ